MVRLYNKFMWFKSHSHREVTWSLVGLMIPTLEVRILPSPSIIFLDLSKFVYIFLLKLDKFKQNYLNIFLIIYKIKLLCIKLLLCYKLDVESYIESLKNNMPI